MDLPLCGWRCFRIRSCARFRKSARASGALPASESRPTSAKRFPARWFTALWPCFWFPAFLIWERTSAPWGNPRTCCLAGPHCYILLMMGLLSLALQIFVPYTRYVKYLKFLAISLLAYVVTAFLVHIDWRAALLATVLPPFKMFHGDLSDGGCRGSGHYDQSRICFSGKHRRKRRKCRFGYTNSH